MNPHEIETQTPIDPPAIQIQSCDGISMVLCRELGVVSFNTDKNEAQQEVADAMISNARVSLRKNPEELDSPEEQLTRKLARFILANQGRIFSVFPVQDLNVKPE